MKSLPSLKNTKLFIIFNILIFQNINSMVQLLTGPLNYSVFPNVLIQPQYNVQQQNVAVQVLTKTIQLIMIKDCSLWGIAGAIRSDFYGLMTKFEQGKIGLHQGNSLLLYGPAGNGKTTLARKFAERTESSLIFRRAIDIVESNKTLENINSCFKQAIESAEFSNKKTVLVIDDIDILFEKCEHSILLKNLDSNLYSIYNNKNIFVVFTSSSHLGSLDLRNKIEIDYQPKKAAKEIIQFHLNKYGVYLNDLNSLNIPHKLSIRKIEDSIRNLDVANMSQADIINSLNNEFNKRDNKPKSSGPHRYFPEPRKPINYSRPIVKDDEEIDALKKEWEKSDIILSQSNEKIHNQESEIQSTYHKMCSLHQKLLNSYQDLKSQDKYTILLSTALGLQAAYVIYKKIDEYKKPDKDLKKESNKVCYTLKS